LEWSNINYIIQSKINHRDKEIERDPESANLDNSPNSSNSSQGRVLLNNIEGFAVPNELLAIMGPSGSGKTTFLNVIAMRQLSKDNHHVITREVNYF
jgi:ABC-type lipoprotein export system ATPase subunit